MSGSNIFEMSKKQKKSTCAKCRKPLSPSPPHPLPSPPPPPPPQNIPIPCPHCLSGLDIHGNLSSPSSSTYCSALCQEQHSKIHSSACQNQNIRKVLYRAGEVLQEVFLLWREISWAWNIEGVQRVEGKLVYDEGEYSSGRGKKKVVKGPFFEFPAQLILSLRGSFDSEEGGEAVEGEEERERERDRKALLSHCGCVEAQEFFVGIGKKLLRDITTRIETVYLNMALGTYTVLMRGNAEHYSHHVLAVDAIDKGSYIIDLSGAQVGLDVIVQPLAAYMERMGATIQTVHDHEYTLACFKDRMVCHDGGRQNSRIAGTQWKMCEAMNALMAEWEEREGDVTEMLHQPEEDYQEAKSTFLESLRKACQDAFDERAALGHPRATADSLRLELSENDLTILGYRSDHELQSPDWSGIRLRWMQEGEDEQAAARLADGQAEQANAAGQAAEHAKSTSLGIEELSVR